MYNTVQKGCCDEKRCIEGLLGCTTLYRRVIVMYNAVHKGCCDVQYCTEGLL